MLRRFVRSEAFPLLILVAVNLAIGLLTFRQYGESFDEDSVYQYAGHSLGVYAGAFWPVESDQSYVKSAYQLYRDYDGALAELKALYNNVETYRYPDDITQCHLLTKVVEKVSVLQMVKYRAIENAKSWGLIPDKPELHA